MSDSAKRDCRRGSRRGIDAAIRGAILPVTPLPRYVYRSMSQIPPEARATWDQYFMNIAREVATRATCDRKHVGAVLVRDRSILATGYNGSLRGLKHCDEVGHLMEDGHCVRTVHAEANAVVQAAKNGVRIDGSTAYVTASPCWNCFRLLVNAGVSRIVFGEFYRDPKVFAFAQELGLELVDLSQEPAAPARGAEGPP